jgi:PilZ domain
MKWLRSILGGSPRGAAPEAPLTQGAGRSENRFNQRFRTGCRFRISWRDKRGKSRHKNVKVLDMSGDGALVKCAVPFNPGTILHLETRDLGLTGSAYVRRCEPLLLTYQIGLEFTGNLSPRV